MCGLVVAVASGYFPGCVRLWRGCFAYCVLWTTFTTLCVLVMTGVVRVLVCLVFVSRTWLTLVGLVTSVPTCAATGDSMFIVILVSVGPNVLKFRFLNWV